VSSCCFHLCEHVEPQRPELEQTERAALGDPSLAIEKRAAIARYGDHVRCHRNADDEDDW
jgi:hypothetical protein